MKSRDVFEELRSQKDKKISLQTRLALYVSIEMFFCVGIGFGGDKLLHRLLNDRWTIPQSVELMALSLVIGVFIMWMLSRQFFAPIKHLREAMARVAEGDFSVRLDEKVSIKEIREVYAGFNMMVSELSATEILKTDFVSSVSHEFKTPISAIEGYSTLLQDCENLDENQRKYVEKILYNTKRLSDLASNILLLSRIEKQSIPTNQKTYALDEQIRQTIVALEPMWDKKDIEFDVDMEDTLYYGNESLMVHVWVNLIGNAIKFNPQGGPVRIRLNRQKNRFLFVIEDGGPGVSEEAQKRIFDKFYQEDTSHKEEGNGLGLALVKNILALEDATISVENIAEGGCRFTVVLRDKHANS